MSYSQLQGEQVVKRTLFEVVKDIKRGFEPQEDRERQDPGYSSRVESAHYYKKPIFTINDMESTFLTLDKSLLYVGDNSTFQKRITLILAIQWISFSFMVNTMAFFFHSPVFQCRIPLTDIYYTCSQNTACNLPEYFYRVVQSGSQQSIAEQFGLFCGQSGNIYEAESLFFFGGFISGYLFSYVSDKIGRRSVILGLLALSIVSMVVCALAPSFTVFRYSYFLAGCFLFGYETQVYLYISQISAVRFKTISVNMLTMVWAGTPMFLPLLGFIPTWRICFIIFASIWFLTLPFAYFCFLESPRFLISKKCYSQVRDIFKQISVTNKRPPYNFRLAEQMLQEQEAKRDESKAPQRERHYNYVDLFRFKSVRRNTLVLAYLWTFRFFIYFALNLGLQSVLKSGFWLTLTIALSSLSQVIGTFGLPIIRFLFSSNSSSIQMIKRNFIYVSIACGLLWFPRVKQDCIDFTQSAMPCYQITLMILLVCCIKFFSSIIFALLITYSSEVFPTVLRSLGYGFSISFGRMSTFIAPFFIDYMRSKYQERNALCFLAPFGLLGAYLCSFMPDSSAINDNIIEEEEEERLRTRQIEMVPMQNQERI